MWYIDAMNINECTPEQLRRIAALVSAATGRPTTYSSLRHAAKGRRGVSADMALAIERAAQQIGLDIRRETLASACAGCEFAHRCRPSI